MSPGGLDPGEAIGRLTELGPPLPRIDLAGEDHLPPGWLPASQLGDAAAWRGITAEYERELGGVRTAVAGSIALQHYTTQITIVLLGCWLQTGAVLDLARSLRGVGFTEGRPEAFAVSPAVREPAAAIETLADELLVDHLPHVIHASRTTSGITGRVAWGNAAAAVAGVSLFLEQLLAPEQWNAWRTSTRALLEDPGWPYRDLVRPVELPGAFGTTVMYERTTCCLIRLAPGRRECTSCNRLAAEERRRRLAEVVARRPPPAPRLTRAAGAVEPRGHVR